MKISFFPSRSITIKTRLSEAQAFERLEACLISAYHIQNTDFQRVKYLLAK